MSKNEITLAKALERVIEFKKCIKEDLEANKGDACFIEDLEVINFIERTLRNYDRQAKELKKLQETRKNLFKIIESKEAEIEFIKKIVGNLTYNLRNNMTSVTRYVKHKKENKPKHLKMQYFNQKHIEYQELAEKAVNNILKCLNENQELRIVENPHNDKICENIKAEAIKEFAERLVDKASGGMVSVDDIVDASAEFLGGDSDGDVSEG